MAARPTLAPEDFTAARQIVLSGIRHEADLGLISYKLDAVRHKNHEFPGTLLLELAADALAVAGVTRSSPLVCADLRASYLPECSARNRTQHYKSKWSIYAAAMIHAGVDPNIDDELAFRATDDFWLWCLEALVVYVRAGADHRNVSVSGFAELLASHHDLVLDSAEVWAEAAADHGF